MYAAALDVLGSLLITSPRRIPIGASTTESEGDQWLGLWGDLVNNASFCIADGVLRFAMGECVSKLIFMTATESTSSISDNGVGNDMLLEQFLVFAERVVFAPIAVESSTPSASGSTISSNSSATDSRNRKGTIATTVLVFLKQSCDRYIASSHSRGDTNGGLNRDNRNPYDGQRKDGLGLDFGLISFTQLNRLCVLLLKLLGTLEKLSADCDPLIQVTHPRLHYYVLYLLCSCTQCSSISGSSWITNA